MFLEYLAFPKQYTGRRARQSFGNDIFLSMLLFTQHFQFQPKTPASRLLATSMALWALLISSAYTANLASFFVDESNIKAEVKSMEEALEYGKPVCVLGTTASAMYVRQAYPTAVFITVEEEKELFLGLTNGLCVASVTTLASFRDYERDKDFNGDCRLQWMGKTIKASKAGFATKADSGKKCTSLVHDVVNLHLLEMEAEGFVDRAWNDHLVRKQDHICSAKNKEDEQSQRRSIHEMGGTFAIHFTVSCTAIALAVATKLWKIYERRRKKGLPLTWSDHDRESMARMNNDAAHEKKEQEKQLGSSGMGDSATTTLIQDFWGPTATSEFMSTEFFEEKGPFKQDNMQLLERLQDEFILQQDRLDKRLTVQQAKFELQQERLQGQLAAIMDFLKESQMVGEGTPTPEQNGNQKGRSSPPQSSRAVAGEEPQCPPKGSKATQLHSANRANKGLQMHQIQRRQALISHRMEYSSFRCSKKKSNDEEDQRWEDEITCSPIEKQYQSGSSGTAIKKAPKLELPSGTTQCVAEGEESHCPPNDNQMEQSYKEISSCEQERSHIRREVSLTEAELELYFT